MKKIRNSRAASPMLVAAFFVLTVLALLVSFQAQAGSEPLEICVRKPSEIARNVEVAQAIAGFGGLERLEGAWKLSGLVTLFAKARVDLTHTRSGFYVQINRSYTKPFYICVNEARPELLILRVQQAEDQSFAKIVLKPGKPGESLQVAVQKSKGKFLKFTRPKD